MPLVYSTQISKKIHLILLYQKTVTAVEVRFLAHAMRAVFFSRESNRLRLFNEELLAGSPLT